MLKSLRYLRFRFTRQFRMVPAVLAGLLLAVPAYAQVTLGNMTDNLYTSFLPAQLFLSSISFLLGVWYVYKGVMMIRTTGEGGQGARSLQESLFKLVGGGALISLPFIVNLMMNTISGGSPTDVITFTGDKTRAVSGTGIDAAMGRFVSDIFSPFMDDALPFFCYIAGLILIIRGIQRLANGDGKNGMAPGGFGTFSIFIIAAALMSLGYFMNVLQGSLFQTTELYANVLLVDQSKLSKQAENVFWAIFQFLRIIGYIAVIRGLFQLKIYADSGQGSLQGVFVHFIAGAMLANIWVFISIVQNTFISDPKYHVFQEPA